MGVGNSRHLFQTKLAFLLNAADLTAATVIGPYGCVRNLTPALVTGLKLTNWISSGEVIRPLGISIRCATTITVTAPQFTVQKAPLALTGASAFSSPSSGGVATASLLTAGSAAFYPLTSYIPVSVRFVDGITQATNFPTVDAVGDQWQFVVTTTATAGTGAITMHYVMLDVAGISDAVTTL